MSDEKPHTPQDSAATQPLSTTSTGPNPEISEVPAPVGTETQEHLSPVAQEPVRASVQAPAPAWATKPQVTYLPPPTGPNWGLVVVGLVFALVGAGVVANQVAGFEVSSLSELGPSVLVIAGLACALLGIIGILTRRRRG
jgi:LPXTG-motif cell wall-anchored protein